MHFQMPPYDQAKVVFVVAGAVRDLVLDLRVGSPTERQFIEVELTPGSGGLLIPRGCGHGYESLLPDTTVVYLLEGMHRADFEAGVNVTSLGFVPSASCPLLSPRDKSLPVLNDFESPFLYSP